MDIDWYSPSFANGGDAFQPANEIAYALESFYLSLEENKFDNLGSIANKAFTTIGTGTIDLAVDTCTEYFIENIYKGIPILRELEIASGIVNITDALYKLISNTDDETYIATTIVRLYYLSYILQPVISYSAS